MSDLPDGCEAVEIPKDRYRVRGLRQLQILSIPEGRALRITDNARTVDSLRSTLWGAAQMLGVRIKVRGDGEHSVIIWRIPKEDR